MTALTGTATAPRAREFLAALLIVGLLALSALYWLLGFLWVTLPVDGFTNRSGGAAGGDFLAFWVAPSMAAAGDAAAAFDLARFGDAVRAVAPSMTSPNPWAYPPSVQLLLRPLAWLSPAGALALWYALILACALLTVRLGAGRWAAAPLALGFFPLVHALNNGQNGTITAALIAVVATQWTRAPALAGIAIGLMSYKPQFAAVAGILALALGIWRIAAVAVLTGLVLLAASLAVDGPAPWLAFLAQTRIQVELIAAGRLPLDRIVTVFAFLAARGVPSGIALAVQAASALAAIATAVWLWQRSEDGFARALALVAATLLATPYAFDYDMAMLALPAALLLRRDGAPLSVPASSAAWLVAFDLVPFLALVPVYLWRVQIGAPFMAVLFIALVVGLRPIGHRGSPAAIS